MLMIRLLRVGRKHDPSFRVVVTEKQNSTKSGRFIEILGHYDARTDKATFVADRVQHWLGHGAQPSGTVQNLLIDAKIMEGKKKNVLPRKHSPQKEESKVEVAATASASTI